MPARGSTRFLLRSSENPELGFGARYAAESQDVLDAYADRWALITGASSGIGAAFAQKLAARGMHLILTARRADRLDQLAKDVHIRHGTRSEVLPGDLSKPDSAKQLVEEIGRRGHPVELLVNNAGFGIVGTLETTELDRALAMLRLNVGAVTELTYRLLPPMIERQHGAVINVSSLAGFQPLAYMGAYAATKAYILHFSEALWAEVRDRGVTVMALCPGVTQTEFFETAGVSEWLRKQKAQLPEHVVKAALKALEKRRQYTIPGVRNYLIALSVRLASRRMVVTESMKYFRPEPSGPTDNQTIGQLDNRTEE